MVKSNPQGHHGGSGGTSSTTPSTFIGFGAFAVPAPAHTHASFVDTSTTTSSSSSYSNNHNDNNSSTNNGNCVWTPVYMGHDDTFRTLFTRIFQKREPITIVKALQELQTCIDDAQQQQNNKKVLVEAMKHYAYLYYHKLSIGSFTASNNISGSGGDTAKKDSATSNSATGTSMANMMISTPTIRAHAVKIWYTFYQYIPKAVMQLCYNHVEILGIIYATQTDPATEVRSTMPQQPYDEQQQQQLLVHPLMIAKDISNQNVTDTKWQKCWNDGIIAYTTTRILSYSKPVLLLEALCGRTTTATNPQQRSNAISLNEQQRDVVDELYIRLVGNCLDCIGQWLQLLHQHPTDGDNDCPILTWGQFTLWFKPFLSYGTASSSTTSKSLNQQQPHAIRRKSYQLLTVITTSAPSIYDLCIPDGHPKNGAGGSTSTSSMVMIQKMLLQAFSVEKDPVNMPHLLETTLSMLAFYNSISINKSNDLLMVLLKPLTKLFNKACYGAKVEIWGPMILPLIGGQYNRTGIQQQHQLLSSLKVGIPFTFGIHEKYHIWIAICETSSFILLRSTMSTSTQEDDVGSTECNSEVTDETAKQIAILWIDGFQFFLSSTSNLTRQKSGSSNDDDVKLLTPIPSTVTNASEGQYRLLQTITDQLTHFHQTTTEQKKCLFMNTPTLMDWFWVDGFSLYMSNTTHLCSLVQLLQELQSRKETAVTPIVRPVFVKLTPILQARFHTTLQEQQVSSGSVPSAETYQFYHSVLNYCGPQVIFDASTTSPSLGKSTFTSLQQFIMNDLMRWSVIHTSSFETDQRHKRSALLVQQDFTLLSTCLNGLPQETRNDTWKAFLREIILAKCDVEYLSVGLATLLRQQVDFDRDWLKCEELDNYAKIVGHLSINDHDFNENEQNDNTIVDEESSETKILKFYRICLGNSDESDMVIVSKGVISSWVDDIYNHYTVPSPPQLGGSLLVSILEAVRRKRDLMSVDLMNCVMISSWYYLDHPSIKSHFIDILHNDSLLRNSFQSRAREQVRVDFHSYIANNAADKVIENWSRRVWFLSDRNEGGILSFPTFGLECIDTWRRNPAVVFGLAMLLLQQLISMPDRLELVKGWAVSDSAEFIVELLTSISEASDDFFLATKCKSRNDRGALFLRAVGGNVMTTDFIDRLVIVAIYKINDEVKKEIINIQPRVAILSLLLELKFPPCQANDLDAISAEDINENDSLWYITDPKNSQNREEVKVAKVHFDSNAGFYFSIVVNRDGDFVERQTVVERLRKQPYIEISGNNKFSDSNPKSDYEDREKLRNLIWNTLLDDSAPVTSTYNIGELMNVLVTQIGFGDDRGIGSVYYDVFRFINSIENEINEVVVDGDDDKLTRAIWTLSFTLGFGLNTPGSTYILSEMWTNPIPCVTRILDYYNEHDVGKNDALDAAVAAFFITGCIGAKIRDHNTILLQRFLMVLFSITASIMDDTKNTDVKMSSVLSYRGILEGISLCRISEGMTLFGSPVVEPLNKALHVTVRYFSEDGRMTNPDSLQLLVLQQIVSACSKQIEFTEILSEISVINAQVLCGCLFVPSKRAIAFKLLQLAAARGRTYLKDDEIILTNETAFRLNKWTEELNEEDTAIIEEDVYIVAEWVPSCLMAEIEGWEDAGFEMENEHTIVGRQLSWFCFLRFVESAAPQHFRNRPAFISYLGKCGAAYSILNLGLLHNEIINDNQKENIPTVDEVSAILERSISPDVTQLSTLSLFRTVEVLPSLCRRWWEDDCPRVYTGPVQALIEKFVAPEILKRELDRMRSSTLFGKMVVSSSLISREVTATYVQDDFTLRVIIALPAAFPFRSAEVDCSKTLGVPQSRWKRWSLQITLMLNSQGGTLQDALMLWKENVDKEFEGVEPCPVCYSVLHVKTHKLPSLQCKTCSNRFHMECLTEWFRSSGKSQCVLCQQPWQGTRV